MNKACGRTTTLQSVLLVCWESVGSGGRWNGVGVFVLRRQIESQEVLPVFVSVSCVAPQSHKFVSSFDG